MPRPLRIEYPGALSRDEPGRPVGRHLLRLGRSRDVPALAGGACAKTAWEVHTYGLMSNHWHAVIETAQGNVTNGTRWLLGTYTQSFSVGYLPIL